MKSTLAIYYSCTILFHIIYHNTSTPIIYHFAYSSLWWYSLKSRTNQSSRSTTEFNVFKFFSCIYWPYKACFLCALQCSEYCPEIGRVICRAMRIWHIGILRNMVESVSLSVHSSSRLVSATRKERQVGDSHGGVMMYVKTIVIIRDVLTRNHRNRMYLDRACSSKLNTFCLVFSTDHRTPTQCSTHVSQLILESTILLLLVIST